MLRNNVTSPKVNLDKVIFSGGSSLNWNIAKPRILAALNTKQAIDFVDVSVPGALDENGDAVEKIPDFHRPCAVGAEEALIQSRLDSQILAILDNLAVNTELINGAPNAQLNAGAKALKVMEAQVKANDETTRILNTRGAIARELESSITTFEKRRENFDLRRAEAIHVFYNTLGTAPLSIAEPFLKECRPRAAFVALDRHYNAGIGGQQAAKTIMAQVTGFSVDLDNGTLSEHMHALKFLAAEWEGGGINTPLGDTFLLEIFIGAVEKSLHQFKDECKFIRQQNLTWDAAMLKLQEREATLMVAKGLNSPSRKRNRPEADDLRALVSKLVKQQVKMTNRADGVAASVVQAAAVTSPQKKSLPKCGKCKKVGHTSENCWRDLICTSCNEKGHIPKFCPKVTGKPLGSPKKTVRVADMLKHI
jgi:hypothetical protein